MRSFDAKVLHSYNGDQKVHFGGILAISVSPDGKWMADGSLIGLSGGSDGCILIFWKPDAEKGYHRFKLPSLARDMDLHPDGLQVATAHYDRHLRIKNLAAKAS